MLLVFYGFSMKLFLNINSLIKNEYIYKIMKFIFKTHLNNFRQNRFENLGINDDLKNQNSIVF